MDIINNAAQNLTLRNPGCPLSPWELMYGSDILSDELVGSIEDVYSGALPEDKARKCSQPIEGLPGEPAEGGSYTGSIRLHRDFHSLTLGNNRNVLVYLPPGYNRSEETRYPVLYLADGQNVFNEKTSFAGVEWGVDETAERLMKEGKMKEVIIVAVSNTPDRMSEYTHVPDPQYGGGNLDKYADFLTRELKPFVDSHYRTLTTSENTGIMGSSLGGLSALYLGWKFPHIFSLVGALSPSLWWAGKDLIGRIANDQQSQGPKRIWMDFGWRESQTDENHNNIPDSLEDAREMNFVLTRKGYKPGRDLFYYEDPWGGHNEWSWSQRVDKVLLALYPEEAQPMT